MWRATIEYASAGPRGSGARLIRLCCFLLLESIYKLYSKFVLLLQ
ncbi:hypothetical protein [Azospirillum melinis]